MNIVGDSMDSIYENALRMLLLFPEYESSPRGQLTREHLDARIMLLNPRSRIISSPARKVNYDFAVGEFLWYWSGRRDLAFVERYNKRLRQFSDDGVILNSAYGHRIFGPYGRGPTLSAPSSQWQTVVDILRRDPDTRQAVLHILRADDLQAPTKDVPCTCNLQFLMRGGRLHLCVRMRSNDVWWGLPYDVFSFTLMQEAMALELGVELGTYRHSVGSFHIYERHFQDAERVLGETVVPTKPMPPLNSLRSLWNVYEAEAYASTGQAIPDALRAPPGSAEAWMMDRLAHKWTAE